MHPHQSALGVHWAPILVRRPPESGKPAASGTLLSCQTYHLCRVSHRHGQYSRLCSTGTPGAATQDVGGQPGHRGDSQRYDHSLPPAHAGAPCPTLTLSETEDHYEIGIAPLRREKTCQPPLPSTLLGRLAGQSRGAPPLLPVPLTVHGQTPGQFKLAAAPLQHLILIFQLLWSRHHTTRLTSRDHLLEPPSQITSTGHCQNNSQTGFRNLSHPVVALARTIVMHPIATYRYFTGFQRVSRLPPSALGPTKPPTATMEVRNLVDSVRAADYTLPATLQRSVLATAGEGPPNSGTIIAALIPKAHAPSTRGENEII